MPDFSLCVNDNCTKKEQCLRFTAKPNEFIQSYSIFEEIEVNGKLICDYFIQDYKYDNRDKRDI